MYVPARVRWVVRMVLLTGEGARSAWPRIRFAQCSAAPCWSHCGLTERGQEKRRSSGDSSYFRVFAKINSFWTLESQQISHILDPRHIGWPNRRDGIHC